MKKFKRLSVLLVILTLLFIKNGFSSDDRMFVDLGVGGIRGLINLTDRTQFENEISKNESAFLTFKGGLVLNIFSITGRLDFYSQYESAMEMAFGCYIIDDRLHLSIGKGYITTDPEGLFFTEQRGAGKGFFSLNLSYKVTKPVWIEAGIRNTSGFYFSLFLRFTL